jgi:hypothetical protein
MLPGDRERHITADFDLIATFDKEAASKHALPFRYG